MFHVEIMTPKDFEFAIKITEPMGWGLAQSDFQFMIKLEPEGCFTLFDDFERIGVATTVSYGEVGWFGNLIIRPDKREKGGGSLLVRHALEYLAKKDVKTVGLYSYIDKIPFYTKLGFKRESEFMVLKGKAFASPTSTSLKKATKSDARAIISLDQDCFGGHRRKLLELILSDPDNIGYTFFENNRLLGFVTAKVYDSSADLGPLECEQGQTNIAMSLLKVTLNELKSREVSVCIPKKETAIISLLKEHGFNEAFSVARMLKGSVVSKDCIYLAESLERG